MNVDTLSSKWIEGNGHKSACVDSLRKLTTIEEIRDRLVEVQKKKIERKK